MFWKALLRPHFVQNKFGMGGKALALEARDRGFEF